MTSDERCNLVLAFARTLFVNGQATDQTVAAAERLGRALGLRANSWRAGASCNFSPTATPLHSAR